MAMLCTRCRGAEAEDPPITCVLEGGPCSPCEERAAIQHQIKQLEEEITKLRAKQKTLGTARNTLHDPFIHKFPPEISSRILYLSLPTSEYYPKTIHRSSSASWAAPLKLGSVCRKWRQLAWATPDLWTTLSIAINSSMIPSIAESLPGLLHEWLDRSGMLPLTIYFFHHDRNSSSKDDLPNDNHRTDAFEVILTSLVIDILRLHSGRWRNLHLTASSDIFKRFFCSTEPKQLVLLQLAATTVRNLALPMPEFMPESELNITHLKLINLPLTSINVRWDNITHATFFELPIDEGLDFLRRASSLEYYCISVSMSERRDNGFTVPIVHPRLRWLHLSAPDLADVLQKITLPSLQEWTQNGLQLPVAAMLSFLKRSGCRIKVLNLDNIRPPSEGLNTLLQKMPSLERMRLSYFSICGTGTVMDGILTRIFYSAPEEGVPGSFLPHLQFIECKMNPDSAVAPFSWSSIPRFYRDGQRRSLTLRTFVHKSDITEQIAVQLLQLTDEGVDLQIVDKVTGEDFLESLRKRMSAQGV